MALDGSDQRGGHGSPVPGLWLALASRVLLGSAACGGVSFHEQDRMPDGGGGATAHDAAPPETPDAAGDDDADPDASAPDAVGPEGLGPDDSAPDDADADADADAAADVSAPPALSALHWAPVHASFTEGDIVSIWGSSSADIYVGTDTQSVYTSGESWMWTGLGPGVVVGAGWASDPEDVYAVGASTWQPGPNGASAGGLYKYRGQGVWSTVASGAFYAVWGSAADDFYVVGEAGIQRSIGGGPLLAEGPAGPAFGVWGSGPTDVYVTTVDPNATILHSAGDGVWQPVYSDATGRALAVSGSGPSDVYALVSPMGDGDAPAHVVRRAADGTWAPQLMGDTTTTLVALWGSGPDDVYAGGWHTTSAGRRGQLFHWVGAGYWASVNLPGTLYEVASVWGSGPGDVYVGAFDVESGAVLLHGQP